MTDNDVSALLHSAVPDPPATLSGEALVRRARRRRATRGATVGCVALVAVGALALAVPDAAGPPADRPVAMSPSASGAGTWPAGYGDDAACADRYPDGLARHPNAWDATVTAVEPGGRNDSGDRRMTLALRVHRVLNGPALDSVSVLTWESMLPDDPSSVVGTRLLVAVGSSLELEGCGYTRRYDPVEIKSWTVGFPDACGIGSPGYEVAREYVGMRVEDAVALAESRDLTVRVHGDDQAWTDDFRTDRVNFCAPEGKVTAAYLY